MSDFYNEIPDYKTLKEIIVTGAQKGGGKRQFVFHDENKTEHERSFNQVWDDEVYIGTYLHSLGYHSGKKIAIISENSYEWNVAYYLTLVGGNVSVPIDTRLSAVEIADQLSNCKCDGVFYSRKLEAVINALKKDDRIPAEHYFLMEDFPLLKEKGRSTDESHKTAFIDAKVDPEDLACIVYTSGTTGRTKGVMLSHKNIASDVTASCRNFKGGHGLGFLPLNHAYTWVSGLFACLVYSEWGYICSNLMHIYKDIKRYKPMTFAAVPLAVEMIYNSIITTAKRNGTYGTLMKGVKASETLMKSGVDRRREMFREIHENLGGNLEYILCGGAHLNEEIEKFMFYIGIPIVTGYGLTECSPGVTVSGRNDYKFGSVGTVLDCNEIKIHEPDENGVGEIYVKGDNVMMGYYEDEEATASVFDGEWFKTGDLGYIDEDGFLFFKGRKKNLIILSNGKNVSPEEIEDKLYGIEYVKEVLVYDKNGLITAEFFLDEEKYPNCRELLKDDVNSINENLAEFKQIQQTIIRDTEFPKTTTLKIMRKYT